MLLLGVDTAIRDEADQMQGTVRFTRALHGLGDGWKVGEFIVCDEEINAGDVHLDNASGAEIEMTDFAVAHLTVWEAHEVLGGADQSVRDIRPGACHRWVCGQGRLHCSRSWGCNPIRRGWSGRAGVGSWSRDSFV